MKKMFGILFFVAALFSAGCKSPMDPIVPPEEIIYYTIILKYTRPEILQADLVNKPVYVDLRRSPNSDFGLFRLGKIDDYHYEVEVQKIGGTKKGIEYIMWGIDIARWDGIDEGTIVVGDIFTVSVKETGFQKQLMNVRQNNLTTGRYATPKAKMVCWTMHEGTISDY
jgi:hypothetical protein